MGVPLTPDLAADGEVEWRAAGRDTDSVQDGDASLYLLRSQPPSRLSGERLLSFRTPAQVGA